MQSQPTPKPPALPAFRDSTTPKAKDSQEHTPASHQHYPSNNNDNNNLAIRPLPNKPHQPPPTVAINATATPTTLLPTSPTTPQPTMSKRTSSAANGAQAKPDSGDSITGPLCTRPLPPPPTTPSSSQLTPSRRSRHPEKRPEPPRRRRGPLLPHQGDAPRRPHHRDERYTSPPPLATTTRLTPPPPTGLCGILSIFSSLRYCAGDQTSHTNLWAALSLLPLGLFFDFFDGKVARWRHKSSLMGQELDSLADLVRPHPIPSTPKLTPFPSTDLLRRRPRRRRLLHRHPHPPRPPLPGLLRALRAHAPGAL